MISIRAIMLLLNDPLLLKQTHVYMLHFSIYNVVTVCDSRSCSWLSFANSIFTLNSGLHRSFFALEPTAEGFS